MSPRPFQRVDTITLAAAGGVRYRVQVGVPPGPPPAAGHPVVYLLDGDAAMPALLAGWPDAAGEAVPAGSTAAAAAPSEPAKTQTAAGEDALALAVAIGYDLPPEQALAARAFDYTPPDAAGDATVDPRVPAWRNGGADAFLEWIDAVLRPELALRHPLDPGRQTLCGHSYGGLCVLHALCTRPGGFGRYVSASPSIWWRDGHVLRQAEARAAAGARRDAEAWILVGDQEQWHPRPLGPDGSAASRRGGVPTLPAARQVAEVLARVPGLKVGFEAVAGGTHATLPALAARRAWQLAGSGAAG